MKNNYAFIETPTRLLDVGNTPAILYGLLQQEAREKGYAEASARQLAAILRTSVRTIRSTIKYLEEAGFISVDRYYTGYRVKVNEITDDKIDYYRRHFLKNQAPRPTEEPARKEGV